MEHAFITSLDPSYEIELTTPKKQINKKAGIPRRSKALMDAIVLACPLLVRRWASQCLKSLGFQIIKRQLILRCSILYYIVLY